MLLSAQENGSETKQDLLVTWKGQPPGQEGIGLIPVRTPETLWTPCLNLMGVADDRLVHSSGHLRWSWLAVCYLRPTHLSMLCGGTLAGRIGRGGGGGGAMVSRDRRCSLLPPGPRAGQLFFCVGLFGGLCDTRGPNSGWMSGARSAPYCQPTNLYHPLPKGSPTPLKRSPALALRVASCCVLRIHRCPLVRRGEGGRAMLESCLITRIPPGWAHTRRGWVMQVHGQRVHGWSWNGQEVKPPHGRDSPESVGVHAICVTGINSHENGPVRRCQLRCSSVFQGCTRC